jgi:hypothetical protein
MKIQKRARPRKKSSRRSRPAGTVTSRKSQALCEGALGSARGDTSVAAADTTSVGPSILSSVVTRLTRLWPRAPGSLLPLRLGRQPDGGGIA